MARAPPLPPHQRAPSAGTMLVGMLRPAPGQRFGNRSAYPGQAPWATRVGVKGHSPSATAPESSRQTGHLYSCLCRSRWGLNHIVQKHPLLGTACVQQNTQSQDEPTAATVSSAGSPRRILPAFRSSWQGLAGHPQGWRKGTGQARQAEQESRGASGHSFWNGIAPLQPWFSHVRSCQNFSASIQPLWPRGHLARGWRLTHQVHSCVPIGR